MLNFVRVTWCTKRPERHDGLRLMIIRDANLSWAAKGLGCFLTTTRDGVRFPNSIWDGTVDALQELVNHGYIYVTNLEEGDE